jgi:hypothetical protein
MANNVSTLDQFYNILYSDLHFKLKKRYFKRHREIYEYLIFYFLFFFLFLFFLIYQTTFNIDSLAGANINPDSLRALLHMTEDKKSYWLNIARTHPVTALDIFKTLQQSDI